MQINPHSYIIPISWICNCISENKFLLRGYFTYSVNRYRPKSIFKKNNWQQYFRYIVEVSFIGGGDRSIRWKPPTRPVASHWQALSHNVVSSTEWDSNSQRSMFDWLIYCAERHFQQYFSYIMAICFNGGRIRSTRREPQTISKQLVSLIICGCESSVPFL
jgi:hypothetical protein